MAKTGSRLILIPRLAKGGAERVAINLLNAGLFDYIITIDGRNMAYPVPADKVINLNSPSSQSLFKKIYNLIIRFVRLKRVKKELNCKLCLSLLEPANLLNVLTRKEDKVVLSFHSNYSHMFREDPYLGHSIVRIIISSLYKIAFKLLYNRADLMVAVSNDMRTDLVKNFGIRADKLKVIYNPVDVGSIEGQSKEFLGQYESIYNYPVLITAGRLTKPKGQWYLLRIFRHLKKDFPDLKLVILGEGELKNYLVNLSESLGLKTFVWDRDTVSEDYDVYFLGFQKNPFKFIARAKLFVFPSLWEGLPNALIEAMACGVPVVSSDCRSGPREILAPDTDFEYQTTKPEFAEYGVLMPVFEVRFKEAHEPLDSVETVWLETLKKVIADEELLKEYAQKAKTRAMDFHIDRIVEEWKLLLNNLYKN